MTGYLINRFDIVDGNMFNQYVAAVTPIISDHQGEVVLGNDAPRSLEGASSGMNVVIAFPSEAAAMAFYDSPEYQPVKLPRLNSTTNGSAIVAPGGVDLSS